MKPFKKNLITSSSPGFKSQAMESFDCEDAVSDFRQHEKTFVEIMPYIWEYVNRYPGFALSWGGGAEICRAHLADFERPGASPTTSSNLHCGLLLYFCCYQGAFFLAYRTVNRMDETVSQFPPSDDVPYYLSDCEFVFNINDISSFSNLTDAIINFRFICECGDEPVAVLKHNIRDYGEEFLDTFGNPNVISYPIGFFHRDQVTKLLTQNDSDPLLQSTGIRFYWGYENNPGGVNNDGYKIKLAAFGIDSDGKNIITKPDSTEGIILEHSWPPS